MAEAVRAPECPVSVSDLPFAGRTGRDVRIAVIDSGVHPDHPHIDAGRIGDGTTVLPDGSLEQGPEATLDRLGHGTAVTAAIQEKAPGALCIPARVFRDALKTSAAALIGAIRWSIDNGADIVNLSLGSVNTSHEPAFARIADEALAAGVLLVAARDANGSRCYPGSLAQVVGVALDWDCPREYYRMESDEGQIFFPASGYPRPIPGVPLQRNLYGISFAVAQISGFAALACEEVGGGRDRHRVDAMRKALIREARSS
ncbi:MAG TPA: S8 family serine peptidase [Sphingobium sp.]|uniref:subtilisin-like serine protease QhpE n=1 Tax=Sphingobium sp. TaxID=1912891 RepID=UPI002ED39300